MFSIVPADGDVSDTLRSMSAKDQVDYVIAKIEEREASLTNVEYQVTQTGRIVNNSTNATIRPGITESLILKRKNGTIWAQSDNNIVDGKPAYTSICNWDGSKARGYTQEHTVQKRPGGNISAKEPEIFIFTRLNNVLGVRTLGAGSSTTLSQWAATKLKTAGVTVTVELKEVGGRQLVGLRAVRSRDDDGMGGTATYWLDPNRDFMISKYEFDNGRTKVDHTVEEAKLVDGVWVPIRVLCNVENTGDDWRSEDLYEVSSFKLNCVKDEDVKVVFPIGCEVVDRVLKVAWKVTPNGIEMLPVGDPRTGEVFDPRSTRVEAVLDEVLKNSGQAGPVYMPSTDPTSLPSHSSPASPAQATITPGAAVQQSSGIAWSYVLLGIAAVLAVAGAIAWRMGRKKASQAGLP
jgi:hypothetical protein